VKRCGIQKLEFGGDVKLEKNLAYRGVQKEDGRKMWKYIGELCVPNRTGKGISSYKKQKKNGRRERTIQKQKI